MTTATQAPVRLNELIERRRSLRAFDARPIAPELLRSVLDAARWAPSSANEQPWSFVVATRDAAEDFERMAATLSDSNRRWAMRAPVLILSVARLRFARTGRPNRHALHDVGLAVENLVLQATALGLVAHQMGGFDVARAREALGLPDGEEPVAVIALGYPGRLDELPEDLRERELAPRTRKPLEEFVFAGRWGEPAGTMTAHAAREVA